MKQPLIMLLATTLFAGGQVAIGSSVPPLAAAAVADGVEVKTKVLTPAQISALVTERVEADGNTIRFSASFAQDRRLTAEKISKYSSTGKIPFRISADAYVYSAAGKKLGLVVGDIHFAVLDAEGKEVVTGSSPTKQMCPT